MELRQFSYIKKIYECGSITKAAQKLFISQPALSNYLSKVEEDLGVKLFDRSANPLIPTYAGEQYLKRANVILMQMDDMNREMRDITKNMTGRIRVAFPGERIIAMLPLVLKDFREIYPNVSVEVVSGPGETLIHKLLGGEADIVFLPSWSKRKGLSQRKIAEEELVLVTGRDYLQDEYFLDREKRVVDWHKVSRLPLITLSKDHALRSSVDVLYKSLGRKPDIFLESHSNMLSCRLAAQGFGFAIVPALTLNLIKSDENLEVYHISEVPLMWEVQAIYREDFYIGDVEKCFLDLLEEKMKIEV